MVDDDRAVREDLARNPVSVAGTDLVGGVAGSIVDPSYGSVLAEARWADPPTAASAMDAARAAGAGWAEVPAERRVDLLRRLADGIEARADLMVLAEAMDTGKPLAAARRALDTAVEGIRAFDAHDLPVSGRAEQWEPLGTACAILPANAALFTAGIRVGAALAAGCTSVLKPPPEAAVTVTMLVRLGAEVGIPDGVLVSVPGGRDVGEALVDAGPDLLLFTGGRPGGNAVGARAGALGVPVRLELGGGANVIVTPGADVDRAADALVGGAFSNQGQVCVSARVIRVHSADIDRFRERFLDRTAALRIGPATDPGTTFGPVQTADRAREMEELARSLDGVLTGGARPDEPSLPPDGFYVSPIVVDGPPPDATTEVFGPVAFIAPYDDLDEVVEEVNVTTSGLAAGVWGPPEVGTEVASRLRTGQVYVNRHFNPHAGSLPGEPWGRSGSGRSGLLEHLRLRRVFGD